MILEKGEPLPAGITTPNYTTQISGHRAFREGKAQLLQFRVNFGSAPGGILPGQALDQIPQFLGDPRSAGAWTRPPAPIQAKAGAMPADDGLRLDNQEDLGPAGPEAAEGGPEEAVARIQGRPWSLAFEHGDLMAQGEDLQRGIASCTEENTESLQHSHEKLDHEILVVTRRDSGSITRRRPSQLIDFTFECSFVYVQPQAVTPLTIQQQQAIVDFEMALSTAQAFDYHAGALNADGASGGPVSLAVQITPAFFVGINDPLGGNPRGTPFTPVIFNLFNAWSNPYREDARASILRGQAIFNSKPINITGVAGLNDDLNLALIPGTCGTCHDSPNVGNHSVSAPLNIGVGDLSSPLDVSYLPVITLQNKTTHEIKTTTDPGRALITGLWKDVGRLKGPILRGLASRAPYFHNGSALTLGDLVDFYDTRFHIGLSQQEKKDLIAFLNSL